MLKEIFKGIVAGALGTVALNVTTYLDMTLRGRASSDAPAKLVTALAGKTGLALASPDNRDQKKIAENRASGLGALFGYVAGFGVGGLYGLCRSGLRINQLPLPLAGVVTGLSAMAVSDTPLVTLNISNPKEWGVSGWAADIIPHLIYGMVTVAAFEAMAGQD